MNPSRFIQHQPIHQFCQSIHFVKNTTHTNDFDSNLSRVRMCDRAQEYPGLILGILYRDLHTFLEVMGWPSKLFKINGIPPWTAAHGKKLQLRRILPMNPQVQHASACSPQSKRLRIKRYIHCYLQMVSLSSLSAFGTGSVGQIGALPCSTRPVHWMHEKIA